MGIHFVAFLSTSTRTMRCWMMMYVRPETLANRDIAWPIPLPDLSGGFILHVNVGNPGLFNYWYIIWSYTCIHCRETFKSQRENHVKIFYSELINSSPTDLSGYLKNDGLQLDKNWTDRMIQRWVKANCSISFSTDRKRRSWNELRAIPNVMEWYFKLKEEYHVLKSTN